VPIPCYGGGFGGGGFGGGGFGGGGFGGGGYCEDDDSNFHSKFVG
jgi:hypothetical protein